MTIWSGNYWQMRPKKATGFTNNIWGAKGNMLFQAVMDSTGTVCSRIALVCWLSVEIRWLLVILVIRH